MGNDITCIQFVETEVARMENNYEHLLFIKELGRLIEDYVNCFDSNIKKEIFKDIKLLGKAIDH